MVEYDVLKLIECGYSFSYIAKLMSGNYNPDTLIPEKKILLKLFKKKHSFKLIGEPLGITDKEVKRWFKYHDLPTTLKEMKKII